MTKIQLFLLPLISLFYSSCRNTNNENNFYLNNVDQQKAFSAQTANNLIKFDKAHSGNFVYKINKENAYSGTFDLFINELNIQKPSKAIITAWVYVETLESDPQMVIEIRDMNFNIKEWVSTKVIEQVQNEKEWTKVKFELDLNINNRNDVNNQIRSYVSNGEVGATYVDDISLIFL